MKNSVMLITYPDSMGEKISDVEYLLDNQFKNVFSGVHLLPFYPSSFDRGFAPLTYKCVDKSFGTFNDIESLTHKYDVMVDFMINHISKESEYYKDYKKNKDSSMYKNLFIDFNEVLGNNPTKEQIDLIYKRTPNKPIHTIEFTDGTTRDLWCTFSDHQIDIDVNSEVGVKFIKENIEFLVSTGVKVIRLDAFAYATKKVNTNCFFIEPDTFELLGRCNNLVSKTDCLLLPEIHEHYLIHKKLEKNGYYTYDFALPMLLLHTIYTKNCEALVNWLKICPRNQFTTLDTHDGIGVVDVEDLLTREEIEFTKESLYKNGGNAHVKYSTSEYNNLDIYQINCTYYSALGCSDNKYLLARAIQMFAPGIPQVYYVGLLSGKNDIDLVESTKEGRNINRHQYSIEEINQELKRDVNIKLLEILRFRTNFDVFDGECEVNALKEKLTIKYYKGSKYAILNIDLAKMEYVISYYDGISKKEIR